MFKRIFTSLILLAATTQAAIILIVPPVPGSAQAAPVLKLAPYPPTHPERPVVTLREGSIYKLTPDSFEVWIDQSLYAIEYKAALDSTNAWKRVGLDQEGRFVHGRPEGFYRAVRISTPQPPDANAPKGEASGRPIKGTFKRNGKVVSE